MFDMRASLAAVIAVFFLCQITEGASDWQTLFRYDEESLHRLEVRDLGFPFVPITLGDQTLWLPFDTGNMVGLTLSGEHFRRLGLPCSDKWQRLDSGGQLISVGCIAHSLRALVFGSTFDDISVYEFADETLPGLLGPKTIPGSRFTLDYKNSTIALDHRRGPDAVSGFDSLPLVRSQRHPRLILVYGTVNEVEVVIEIDTGKSRTTVDRGLVRRLELEEGPKGARIGTVELGPRSKEVSWARVVDTSGISHGLPSPISLGLGSDTLSQFVWTVDYKQGRLWIEAPASTLADRKKH
jgi:hypothetical protein